MITRLKSWFVPDFPHIMPLGLAIVFFLAWLIGMVKTTTELGAW